MNIERTVSASLYSTVCVVLTSAMAWSVFVAAPGLHTRPALFALAAASAAICIVDGHRRAVAGSVNRLCLIGAAYGLAVSAAMALIG